MDLAAAYRRMIERMNEAVLVIQDNRFQFANLKADRLLGYSQTELASISLQRIVHNEDLGLVLRHSTECLCAEGHRSNCTFKIVPKTGAP